MQIGKYAFSACVFLSLIFANSSALANASERSCKLKYPVVLSHHWGVRLCSGECPHEPQDNDILPPRISNMYDNSLSRPNMGQYYRYYSRHIVDRLEKDCGNDVFLADKPAYASYHIRAKSLRNTVKQALAETGAEKVVIIGMSQGVQDARYLASHLYFDDDNPSLGTMADYVGAIVSVVGEDTGAESSSLMLSNLYLSCGWDNLDCEVSSDGQDNFLPSAFWLRDGEQVLTENQPTIKSWIESQQNQNTLPADRTVNHVLYQSYLTSLINLSTKYMNRNNGEDGWVPAWDELLTQADPLGTQDHQSDCDQNIMWCVDNNFYQNELKTEKNNGVQYYSYAGKVRNWTSEFNDSDGFLSWLSIAAFWLEASDAYVSMSSQSFADKKDWPNFKHVKTLSGKWLSRGYHHMWFSGRYDHLLAPPKTKNQEPPPYDGGSDDFYEQVMVDLIAEGF